MAKKIIAQSHHYFHLSNTVKPQLSPFCHFCFFFSQCEEKISPFLQHSMKTGGNVGAAEESGDSRYDPADRIAKRGGAGRETERTRERGRGLCSDTPYDDAGDPGQRTE